MVVIKVFNGQITQKKQNSIQNLDVRHKKAPQQKKNPKFDRLKKINEFKFCKWFLKKYSYIKFVNKFIN